MADISLVALVVEPDNDSIEISENVSWWDGIGIRESDEWCYECILVHEIGHTLGLGHTGDGRWSKDGFTPTMVGCGDQALVALLDSLQQDDWGGASYADWGSRSNRDSIWTSNAGFESDLKHWVRSSTTDVTFGSAYADAGSRGVRMANDGNWLHTTSVYDPYFLTETGQFAVTNMDVSDPELRVRTRYRHAFASSTGGVKVQYDTWFLQYTSSGCKADATTATTNPSGVTDLNTCGDQGTTWKKCGGGVEIDNSAVNDATVFMVYVESTSSGPLYVDKVGAHGGTTP